MLDRPNVGTVGAAKPIEAKIDVTRCFTFHNVPEVEFRWGSNSYTMRFDLNLVLGTDTTTTYDHRHLIEVHLGTDHSRERVKFDDIDGGPHSLVRTCFAPAL